MKRVLLALFAVLAWCCSSVAGAQNLVTNGGFELGGVGWTVNGGQWSIGGPPSHTGTNSAGTGCVGSACITTDPGAAGAWIFQDIPTVAGKTYQVSFWYDTSSAADTPVELQVFFGTVPASVNAPGTCTGSCIFDTQTAVPGWTLVSKQVVATGPTMRLEFLGRNDPAGIFIDDAAVALVNPVPATSHWSLILLATLLLAAAGFQLARRAR